MWSVILLFCLPLLVVAFKNQSCPHIYEHSSINKCLSLKNQQKTYSVQLVTATFHNIYNQYYQQSSNSKQGTPNPQCLVFVLNCAPGEGRTTSCKHQNGSLQLQFELAKTVTATKLRLDICQSNAGYALCPVRIVSDPSITTIYVRPPSNAPLSGSARLCNCSNINQLLKRQLEICNSSVVSIKKIEIISIKSVVITVFLMIPVAFGGMWVSVVVGATVFHLAKYVKPILKAKCAW